MPLESSNNIEELDKTYPLGGDQIAQGAAHIRNIKSALKLQFPGIGGNGFNVAIDATEDELDRLIGITGPIQAQIDAIKNLGTVPLTGILIFEGIAANIPANYQFCDGTNGTPDLRNKFVMGTTTQSQVGTTGGSADSVVVTHSHSFNHNHTVSLVAGGAHTHPHGGGVRLIAVSTSNRVTIRSSASDPRYTTGSAGNHTHTVNAGWSSVSTSTTGESATGRNLPAYYKLSYIMRVT